MFDGFRSLFSHLAWLAKNEAKQGLIHLAKYVIARCEGAPPGARREPYNIIPPPPPVEPPPVKQRPRRQIWN